MLESGAIDIIQSSLSGTQLDKGNVGNLITSIKKARDYVDEFDVKTRAKFQQALDINLSVQKMQAQAMNKLSPQFRSAVEEQEV
ncbi:hypothetical protein N8865_01035 [Francisellaceae bacterium]|nr:hypothetical protein [Francisellaceae bacterium]